MTNKLADSYFNINYRKYIINEFSQYGLKKYKSNTIARIVNKSIFQLINFQKDAYGSKNFTVNVAILPLYIPNEYLALEPGNRLAAFMNQRDKWWDFKTEADAEYSFNEVSKIIKENVINMFDILSTNEALIKYYDTDVFPIRWYNDKANGIYRLGFILLKEHKFEEGIDNFKKASELYRLYGDKWSKEKYRICIEILKLCSEEIEKIDDYLEKCERLTINNLKIVKQIYIMKEKTDCKKITCKTESI